MEAKDIAWAVDAGIRSGFADVIPALFEVLYENNNATASISELEAKLASANGLLDEVDALSLQMEMTKYETDVEWMILVDILAKRKDGE